MNRYTDKAGRSFRLVKKDAEIPSDGSGPCQGCAFRMSPFPVCCDAPPCDDRAMVWVHAGEDVK